MAWVSAFSLALMRIIRCLSISFLCNFSSTSLCFRRMCSFLISRFLSAFSFASLACLSSSAWRLRFAFSSLRFASSHSFFRFSRSKFFCRIFSSCIWRIFSWFSMAAFTRSSFIRRARAISLAFLLRCCSSNSARSLSFSSISCCFLRFISSILFASSSSSFCLCTNARARAASAAAFSLFLRSISSRSFCSSSLSFSKISRAICLSLSLSSSFFRILSFIELLFFISSCRFLSASLFLSSSSFALASSSFIALSSLTFAIFISYASSFSRSCCILSFSSCNLAFSAASSLSSLAAAASFSCFSRIMLLRFSFASLSRPWRFSS
mmetsp:Transcript_4473/g.6349  ORF Transcript_4473/g.6349 Transcript_4473/m.6349 type:complete len:324 (-) Transcript_4473:177-1148(-)